MMRFSNLIIFFLFTLFSSSSTFFSSANVVPPLNDHVRISELEDHQPPIISLRGSASLRLPAAQKLPENYTCDAFPRVCRLKGSAGPDCCKKKCVNVKTDRFNCGMCGCKCKYSEICCRGKCVNASFDKRHCGGCNQKCKKDEVCAYGMCSYA